MPVNGPVAFNIVVERRGQERRVAVAGGALYSVDLKTGKATMVGKIEGLRRQARRHRLGRLSALSAFGLSVPRSPAAGRLFCRIGRRLPCVRMQNALHRLSQSSLSLLNRPPSIGLRSLFETGSMQWRLPVKLDHCVVHVSDWERSNAFYRDVLGAELIRRPEGLGLSLRRHATQSARAGLHAGRSGAAAGAARQQRSVLRMERADRRRHRASRALRRADRARADGALRRQGRRHQRLFPRSRRLAARIHFLSSEAEISP